MLVWINKDFFAKDDGDTWYNINKIISFSVESFLGFDHYPFGREIPAEPIYYLNASIEGAPSFHINQYKTKNEAINDLTNLLKSRPCCDNDSANQKVSIK